MEEVISNMPVDVTYKEYDLSNFTCNISSPYIFEYLSYPLHGYKPFSILELIKNDDKIFCIVVYIPDRFQVCDYLRLDKMVLSRIPKSLRNQLRQRIHICVIHGVCDKEQYEGLFNNVPEIVDMDKPSTINYTCRLDKPLI